MRSAVPRPVLAYLVDSDSDEAGVERADVTRSEALELAERFWTATEGYADGRIEEGIELTLSFARDDKDDGIELSTFGRGPIGVGWVFIETWKLFWLIPMRSRRTLSLDLHDREEVIALVDAYMTQVAPGAFTQWMLAHGAVLLPYR